MRSLSAPGIGFRHPMRFRILPAQNHRFWKGRNLRMFRLGIRQRVFDPPEIRFAVSINGQYLAHCHANLRRMARSVAGMHCRQHSKK